MKKMIITGLRNKEREADNQKMLGDIHTKTIAGAGMAAADPDVPFDTVLDETNAEVDELVTDNIQTFQTKSQQKKVDHSQTMLDERKQAIADKRAPIKNEMKGLRADIQRTDSNLSMQKVKWVTAAILTIAGVDALINFKSFQILTDNLLIALLVAILTVGGLALSAHVIGKYIREAPTRAKRILYFALGLAGGAVIFFMLGLLRQAFYGGSEGLVNHPIIWVIYNLFFYACAIAISALYLPAKKEWAAHETYMILKKKLNELEQHDRQLEAEAQRLQREHNQLVEDIEDLKAYEQDTLARIEKSRATIIAAARKEYALKGGMGHSSHP